MGFRDFGLFNQAMLAKQGWRLLTSPDSLCARVLKGRYYPNSDFMSASNKRNSSHTWRAILHGRETLKLGLIKRVGDGASIKIWEDPWIASNHGYRPIIRLPGATATKVEDLIDHENGTWNQEALESNFVAPDIHAIRAMPISNWGDDVWAWEKEKNGHFIVRSAYKILSKCAWQSDVPSSSGETGGNFWKKLWKMAVPPKVKKFWWRVIEDFVPCRAVLLKRHIEKLPFCKFCGKEETIIHALFQCTWARLFWMK